MGKRTWLSRALAFAAKRCPCRRIPPEGDTYLTRYFLLRLPKGAGIFLHFFHRSDADGELHSHPWWGLALLLGGGYREERRVGHAGAYRVESRICVPLSFNLIRTDTFHRVDLLDPKAGCWTLFFVGPRTEEWGFWNRDSGMFTPWDEFQTAKRLRLAETEEGVRWPTSEAGLVPWGAECRNDCLRVVVTAPLSAPVVPVPADWGAEGSCRVVVTGDDGDDGMGIDCASLDEARDLVRRFPAVLTMDGLFDLGLRREF